MIFKSQILNSRKSFGITHTYYLLMVSVLRAPPKRAPLSKKYCMKDTSGNPVLLARDFFG
jgi:hypothetical protein